MGKSPSIADLENKEDAFRSYIDKLQGELQKKSESNTATLEKEIKSFYENSGGWKHSPFVTGESYDFQQSAEWSMANVKKVIDLISKAVFGDSADLPKGITVKKTEDISSALAEMENFEVYVVGKVFEVLSGIVESFGSATSVSFKYAYKDEPIGNGFHLFAIVANDGYKSKDFFKNEEIIEYLYAYRVHFSPDEAKKQADIEITKLYEDQIETYADKVEGLLKQLEDDQLTPEQYQSQSKIYNILIKASKKKLLELTK